MKFLAFIFPLIVSTSVTYPKPNETRRPPTQKRSQSLSYMTQMEYEQRMERIKSNILDKMGLEKRPVKTKSKNDIPKALFEEFQYDVQMREQEEKKKIPTSKVIALAQNASRHYCKDTHCIEVSFKEIMKDARIVSMEIWIHKLQEFKIDSDQIQVVKRGDDRREVLLNVNTGSESGWVVTNVMNSEDGWIKTNGKDKILDITLLFKCGKCNFTTEPQHKPFIVITTEVDANVHRSRRSIESCDPKTECCTESLWVDFGNIGWDDFILSPQKFNARICKGTCGKDHIMYHEHMGIIRNVHPEFVSCCNPQKYGPVEMLYFNDSGNMVQKVIENMVALECGCS